MNRLRTFKLAVAVALGLALSGLVVLGGVRGIGPTISWALQEDGGAVGDVPYVPTPESVVEAMLDVAGVDAGDVVYDLGCGDGRILIAAAAERGARGVGVDIDPERIRESRENARAAGVEERVEFRVANLFETDVSEASVVTLYLMPSVNVRLRPVLLRQLRPGSRVVSHSFDMDEWRPDRRLEVEAPGPYDLGNRPHRVFLWIVPADVAGSWRAVAELSGPEGAGGPPSYRREFLLHLRQRFQDVSGRAEIEGGEAVPIVEPSLRGRRLELSLIDRIDGRTSVLRLRGAVRGDRIEGTVTIDGGPRAGEYRWSATRRVPEEVPPAEETPRR